MKYLYVLLQKKNYCYYYYILYIQYITVDGGVEPPTFGLTVQRSTY